MSDTSSNGDPPASDDEQDVPPPVPADDQYEHLSVQLATFLKESADAAYMKRRAKEDDEAASLALAAQLAESEPTPAPADDEPDDATKALLAEYAPEERAAREARERGDTQPAADEKSRANSSSWRM